MTSKKILITGGGGFIGSFLTEKFYKDNQVTLFDNGRRNSFHFLDQTIRKQVNFVSGDIRDDEKVSKIVKGQDIVIHMAAIAGASFYETDPLLTLDVNLFGTANLLKALIKSKAEKIITFSTSEVYGSLAADVSEDDPTCIGPVSEGRWSYAVSKIASDHLARAYFKKYSLPVNMIRPFNIYGPRQVGEGAVSNMLTQAIKTGKIYVSGDGAQKRAWCYISDMVEAVKLALEEDVLGECFNVGNSDAYVTILELAKKIQSLVKGSEIIFTEERKVEVLDRKPNVDKAKRVLGYSPKVTLEQGLGLTYRWWTDNILNFKNLGSCGF
ncbi:NAD-dependent epimerase/dehydratase family protein [Candidatus Daviesbacteria bacterium]|nr:NAD-dependent epimerase/dehydratase family protein [Candidatus Daviesbacteria bacterium]